MDVEERTVEIPGLQLALRLWGPSEAPPVLALHGWMDSAASFDLLIPKLGDLRVAALDLAGHGHSDDLPSGVPYTFLDWVVQARDAADTLGWQRFAILGHSLGAGIANALAGTWPERVSRVALIDGFSPRTQEPEELPARLAEYVSRRDKLDSTRARVLRDPAEAALRLTETLEISSAAAEVLVGRAIRATADGVVFRRDPRIPVGPPMRLAKAQIRALIGSVRCPALLVRPTDGWPIPAEILIELREVMPQLQVETITGGHHVHLERPDVVAELVRPFLADS